MKINKKILLAFGIFVFVIFLAIIFKPNSQNGITPSTGELPNQNIPNYLSGSQIQINLNFKQSDFNFPTSLPVLNINSANISLNDAQQIANNFGLNSQPLQLNDINQGLTYLWQDNNQVLTVYSGSGQISYDLPSLVNTTSKGAIGDTELISRANSFLVNKFNFSQDQIKFSFFTYATQPTGSEELNYVSKSAANFYIANFSYDSTNLKIVTLKPTDSLMKVNMLSDGTILHVTAYKYESINPSSSLYNLKNYDQVKANIGQATIVSLNNGNTTLTDLTPQNIKNINITNIETAYLMDSPTTKVLQPIFLLSGTATLTTNTTVTAVLYLPAIVNQ